MKNIKNFDTFVNEELFGLSSKEKLDKNEKQKKLEELEKLRDEEIDREDEELFRQFDNIKKNKIEESKKENDPDDIHHDYSKKFNMKDFDEKNAGGSEHIDYKDSDRVIDKSPLNKRTKEANDRGKKITYKQSQDFRKKLVATTLDDVKVYFVDGTHVRDKIDIDYTMGGHGYVYPNYVPEDEIWIDEDMDVEDKYATTVHEMTERIQMRDKHIKYSPAHDTASSAEEKVRKKIEK